MRRGFDRPWVRCVAAVLLTTTVGAGASADDSSFTSTAGLGSVDVFASSSDKLIVMLIANSAMGSI